MNKNKKIHYKFDVDGNLYWQLETAIGELKMEQPTKKIIVEKLELLFDGKMTREEICEWSMDFIRNDNEVLVTDIEAWHYLVAISKIDEMITPNEYLFSGADIRAIMNQY